MGIGGAIPSRLNEMMEIWNLIKDEGLLLAVSEWNVGESGLGATLINGLMRSASLLRMFAEMIQSDVDLAHIWSMQTAGPAGLSDKEGSGSEWSPTGYLYNMLIDGAKDAELVDTGASFRLRDDTNAIVGYTYTFSQENRTDVFLSSGVDYDFSLDVNLLGLLKDASHVYVTVLTSAPGTAGTEYDADASLEFLMDETIAWQGDDSEKISVSIGAYETIQITLTYGVGISVVADHQNAISDELAGSAFDDKIDGGLGADSLFGHNGNDILMGGDGDDSIFGGNHNDTIYGDEGDDFIFGGSGNDLLDGGLGYDYILGGSGKDRIISNGFADMIDGGADIDTLSLAGLTEGASVWMQLRIVEVGNEIVEYDRIEIIETTEFKDTISLESVGVQQVFALGGDDHLRVWGAEDVSVFMGDGNDYIVTYAGGGNKIFGGNGEDSFLVYDGSNTFFGGAGDDSFLLSSPFGSIIGYEEGDGDDIIHNFTLGRDTLRIDLDLEEDLYLEHREDGTTVHFGKDSSISLPDVFDNNLTDYLDFI